MSVLEYLGAEVVRALPGAVQVVDAEREQRTVAPRPRLLVPEVLVLVHVPVVELEDEVSSHDDALVLPAAVPARAAEEVAVPARRLDVRHRDQRLRDDPH